MKIAAGVPDPVFGVVLPALALDDRVVHKGRESLDLLTRSPEAVDLLAIERITQRHAADELLLFGHAEQ